MQLHLKKMIEAMTQAMACMYSTQKNPCKKLTGTNLTGGKPYLGKSKPAETMTGLDGTIDSNLTCQYCKDTGYKCDNSRKLQQKYKENS